LLAETLQENSLARVLLFDTNIPTRNFSITLSVMPFFFSTFFYIQLQKRKKIVCFSYYRINKIVNKTYMLFLPFRITNKTTLLTLNPTYTTCKSNILQSD